MSSHENSHMQAALQKVLSETQGALVLGAHGIASFAWLWPVRGIYFAITHPNVIMGVRPAIVKSLVASAVIFGLLMFFTYIPQMAILAAVSGPLAPVLAIVVVGAESAFLLALLARPLFLEPALTQVFDNTLRARGQGELVKAGKTRGKGATVSVESALVKPLQILSTGGIVRYLITLPINMVPVLGTVLFVLYNGYTSGPGWHSRYFQLKGFSKNQRQAFVDRKRGEYAAFGSATLLFNYIPLIGLLFSFTNTIGAAMWAAQLEAQANIIDAPQSTNKGKQVSQPVGQDQE
ncbi:uncharacterized protein C8Q71DRAFT_798588 [Rhodofomes roseus]|uniref:CysZ protein n=1 Tax=Rhodofomes roseus TaxID=34475 RepID=A0A4Y9Z4P0_9APHY|nr:uncharacterized protein C8Q71DRAFT_798588 [Rhodofomes roseus]KAH9832555.1 hypothetical protein C8Q71DRAFT_798588 [Rhodofomes roseus]TFY68848.1 hypothetical protein EVJ58_g769 [Rhodofomes roseus]